MLTVMTTALVVASSGANPSNMQGPLFAVSNAQDDPWIQAKSPNIGSSHSNQRTVDNLESYQHWTDNQVAGNFHLWPNKSVPYTIDSNISQSAKSSIEVAVQIFRTEVQCLSWVRRGSERDYVHFVWSQRCLSSPVGRVGRRQNITISSQCSTLATILPQMIRASGIQMTSSKVEHYDREPVSDHEATRHTDVENPIGYPPKLEEKYRIYGDYSNHILGARLNTNTRFHGNVRSARGKNSITTLSKDNSERNGSNSLKEHTPQPLGLNENISGGDDNEPSTSDDHFRKAINLTNQNVAQYSFNLLLTNHNRGIMRNGNDKASRQIPNPQPTSKPTLISSLRDTNPSPTSYGKPGRILPRRLWRKLLRRHDIFRARMSPDLKGNQLQDPDIDEFSRVTSRYRGEDSDPRPAMYPSLLQQPQRFSLQGPSGTKGSSQGRNSRQVWDTSASPESGRLPLYEKELLQTLYGCPRERVPARETVIDFARPGGELNAKESNTPSFPRVKSTTPAKHPASKSLPYESFLERTAIPKPATNSMRTKIHQTMTPTSTPHNDFYTTSKFKTSNGNSTTTTLMTKKAETFSKPTSGLLFSTTRPFSHPTSAAQMYSETKTDDHSRAMSAQPPTPRDSHITSPSNPSSRPAVGTTTTSVGANNSQLSSYTEAGPGRPSETTQSALPIEAFTSTMPQPFVSETVTQTTQSAENVESLTTQKSFQLGKTSTASSLQTLLFKTPTSNDNTTIFPIPFSTAKDWNTDSTTSSGSTSSHTHPSPSYTNTENMPHKASTPNKFSDLTYSKASETSTVGTSYLKSSVVYQSILTTKASSAPPNEGSHFTTTTGSFRTSTEHFSTSPRSSYPQRHTDHIPFSTTTSVVPLLSSNFPSLMHGAYSDKPSTNDAKNVLTTSSSNTGSFSAPPQHFVVEVTLHHQISTHSISIFWNKPRLIQSTYPSQESSTNDSPGNPSDTNGTNQRHEPTATFSPIGLSQSDPARSQSNARDGLGASSAPSIPSNHDNRWKDGFSLGHDSSVPEFGVRYFLVSYTPSRVGGASTAHLSSHTYAYSIQTNHFPGGVFTITLKAALKGMGDMTIQRTIHVRAACDSLLYIPTGTLVLPPHLPNPENYPSDVRCRWKITSPEGTRLLIRVDHVNLNSQSDSADGSCRGGDFLRVFLSTNSWTLCESGQKTLATEDNSVGLLFLSTPGPRRLKPGGFQLSFTVLSLAPRNVTVLSTPVSFLLSWKPPEVDDAKQCDDHVVAYFVEYGLDPGQIRRVILTPSTFTFPIAAEYGRLYQMVVGSLLASGREEKTHSIRRRALCGHTVSQPEDIASPYYPENYRPNTLCRWRVRNPQNSTTTLTVSVLDLWQDADCHSSGDYLAVEGFGRICGRFSSGQLPLILTLTREVTDIVFVSDRSGEKSGFFLRIDMLRM